jgi:putative addiction module component (TIGR02574 family)
LTFEQRQMVIRRALELDDPTISETDEALVEARLAAHRADPGSSVSLEEMKARIRSERQK